MSVEEIADSRTIEKLESVFGFRSFRPLQEEIVRAILAGQDVFALLPTGGGKSLCYQLPSLLLEGVTVVVSPLIALMKDQVDALRVLGIPATYINSSLNRAEIERRQEMVTRGEVKLVYVAPERLMMEGFFRLLAKIKVPLFAIDEAHCISEWGHDFRPEYRALDRLRGLFPNVPTAAFTATATNRVRDDIISQLGLQNAAHFRGSFNRPNLFYVVVPKRGAYEQMLDYLRERPTASGIIYCGSRAGTEDLARRLGEDGVRAVAYHAGLEPEERRRRQEAFTRDDVRIMTATIAFGMGIDKPDVRFVMHFDLPKTLENYYQESGRAGRDGERSDCILYYGVGDLVRLRHFAEEKPTAAERRVALQQLQRMAHWAESTVCRRRSLLAYFDESFDRQEPPCCDVCLTPGTEEDVTIAAQMFLSCAKRTGERFGADHLIKILRGSRGEKVLRFGHEKLSTYGIGRDRSEEQWWKIAKGLVQGGYLSQDPDRFNALTVTEQGRGVLFDNETVSMVVSVARAAESHSSETQVSSGLFDRLRTLRKRIADDQGIPPYVIFHDRTLWHIAVQLPTDREQLRRISGIGERKVSDYGEQVLECVAAYVEETGAVAAPPPPLRGEKRRERGLNDSAGQTLRLFREGCDVAQIMETRGLSEATIVGHLVDALEAGQSAEVDRLVAPPKQEAIRAAMEELGDELLAPIKERLGDSYTYGELRLMRAAMRLAEGPNRMRVP